MHVLAAIDTTGPDDDGDAAPLSGEMVVLPLEGTGHGDVGLRRAAPRSFVGLDSHADVTSVEVVELDVTPHVVMGHVRESLTRQGAWPEDHLVDTAARLTAEMLSVAEQFPVGTIIEKDGRLLQALVPIRAHGRRPACDRPDHGRPPS